MVEFFISNPSVPFTMDEYSSFDGTFVLGGQDWICSNTGFFTDWDWDALILGSLCLYILL